MTPLGIGLVGLGHWGRNYVKTLLALPECRLVAAADAESATRARAASEADVTVRASLDELLSDPAVEAVVVATPDRTHYSLASAALAAGRDVLVEKPMAVDPAEAEALAGQAETGGHVLAVGHTAVYHSSFAALMDEIRTGLLVPWLASAVRTSSGYSDGRSNPILDLCPHDIAAAVLLFGTAVAARAYASGNGCEYEVRFADDALLLGRAEWRTPPHVRRFEVVGAKASLTDAGAGQSPPDIRDTPLSRQCLDFIACCRNRRQPLSNGRVGTAVTRCISAIVASCADGNTWVPLPPELRAPTTEQRTPSSGPQPSNVELRA